jgi:hypothetical protein
MRKQELLFIAVPFCDIYKKLWGKEYWLLKKWIRGEDNLRIEQELQEVWGMLRSHGTSLTPSGREQVAYFVRCALHHFRALNIKPTPKFLARHDLRKKFTLQDYRRALEKMELAEEMYAGAESVWWTLPGKLPVSRHGKHWTAHEDESLKFDFIDGQTIDQLAARHGRSPVAIRSRLFKMKLIDDWRDPASAADTAA